MSSAGIELMSFTRFGGKHPYPLIQLSGEGAQFYFMLEWPGPVCILEAFHCRLGTVGSPGR